MGHAEQVDKEGTAYILHPLTVMNRVRHLGESHMIVAVLHDYVEDCAPECPCGGMARGYLCKPDCGGCRELYFLTPEELYALMCVTKRKGESYEARIERVLTSPIGMAVKEQDLIHNLDGSRMPNRPLTEADYRRWYKYRCALERIREVRGQRA